MADAELKGGYTPISNALLEAVYRLKLNGTQLKIILFIWRYTYGFHRFEHEMSIQFIASGIGVSFRTTAQEIRNLVKNRVILETARPKGNHSRVLKFNQNCQEWTAAGGKAPVQEDFGERRGGPSAETEGKSAGSGEEALQEKEIQSSIEGGEQLPEAMEDTVYSGRSGSSIEGGGMAPEVMEGGLYQEKKGNDKTLNKGVKKGLKKEGVPLTTPMDKKRSELIGYYEQKIGSYSPVILREIMDWRDRVDDSLIRYAVDEAVKQDKKRWCYIRAILKHHYEAGTRRRQPPDGEPGERRPLSIERMTNDELEQLALKMIEARQGQRI